jgi:hypothetical protein
MHSMQTSTAVSRAPLKLFLTCWLIFVLHFATDIVREHYLAFSLAERHSFSSEEYLGLHIDIFELPGRGAFISNNPGVSMFGAVPYAIFRPVIQRIVDVANRGRGANVTAVYNDPRPRRVEFYRKIRERGLDIQFALAAAVMQAFFMAPLSAFAAVVMFGVLRWRGLTERRALLYSFLYALGTPVFFRTAYLNQNLFLAHLTFFAFVILWRSDSIPALRDHLSPFAAGALCGLGVLSDYSGVVPFAILAIYACWNSWSRDGFAGAVRTAVWFGAGATGPILLLLFYQWRAFGSPWYPAQHYMPAVTGIENGYRGLGWPSSELLKMLLVDPRFGLFVTAPFLLLALAATWLRAKESLVDVRERVVLFALAASIVIFFSGVAYTRVEWVTGTRYVVPAVPALFLLTLVTLERLAAPLRFLIVVGAFTEAWCLSMVRAIYVHESIEHVFLGGFQLPWMNVLVKMAPQYFPWMVQSSPLALFVLCAILIAGLWRWEPFKPHAN